MSPSQTYLFPLAFLYFDFLTIQHSDSHASRSILKQQPVFAKPHNSFQNLENAHRTCITFSECISLLFVSICPSDSLDNVVNAKL